MLAAVGLASPIISERGESKVPTRSASATAPRPAAHGRAGLGCLEQVSQEVRGSHRSSHPWSLDESG